MKLGAWHARFQLDAALRDQGNVKPSGKAQRMVAGARMNENE
jgi:hypothetical protein